MKWLRISLRETLMLIVIVAMALGWWIDRDRLANQKAILITKTADCIAVHFRWNGFTRATRNIELSGPKTNSL